MRKIIIPIKLFFINIKKKGVLHYQGTTIWNFIFWVLSLLLLLVIISLMSIIIYATLRHTESTIYMVNANTEYVTYNIIDDTAPSVSINNFTLFSDCDEEQISQDITEKSILKFINNPSIIIKRINDNHLSMFIQTKPENASVGSIISATSPYGNKIILAECARIILDNKSIRSSSFSMNLNGLVSIGRRVTDAVDDVQPIIYDGQISLIESSLFSDKPFQLENVNLTAGDSLRILDSKKNIKGFIRVFANQKGISITLNAEGGRALISKYRSTDIDISGSFIMRMIYDNELGWILSMGLTLLSAIWLLLNLLNQSGMRTKEDKGI